MTKIDSARRAIAKESGGFAVAELASMGISLGVVAVFDQLIPQSITHAITKTVAKICVEPFLDPVETMVGSVCRLEECKIDKTKPREERAENIARWLVIGGAAWGISLGAKVAMRHWINEAFDIAGEKKHELPPGASKFKKFVSKVPLVGSLVGMTRESKLIILADEGIHYGSLLYLNSKGAKFTDGHIRTTQSMLEKLGLPEKTAHEMSTWIWVWEMPNIAGMAAGMGVIAGKHAYGWPEKHQYRSFKDLVTGAPSLAGERTK